MSINHNDSDFRFTSSVYRLISVVITLALCLGQGTFAQPLGTSPEKSELVKSPVPSKADRDSAREEAVQLFAIDQLSSGNELTAVLQRMLKTAKDSTSTPVDQFVLLNLVREKAAEAGEVRLAWEAVDNLENHFQFDTTPVRMATLGAAIKARRPAEQKRDVVVVGVQMMQWLVERDDYVTAEQIGPTLVGIAQRVRDRELINQLNNEYRRVTKLKKAYETVEPALTRLKADPDDPAANLAYGRFQLFAKGDWPGALASLSKGSDEQLARIAKAELANPREAANENKLADAWWAQAATESEPEYRQLIEARAGFWYEQCVDGLTGLTQVKARKRLEQAKTAMMAFNPARSDYLDDLRESSSVLDSGLLAKHGLGFRGERRPIWKQNVTHSLLMHAKTKGTVQITYELDGTYDKLETVVGLVDKPKRSATALTFVVLGDGKPLWTSRPVRNQGVGQTCDVSIRGVKKLTLKVQCPGSNDWCHAVWMYPQITRQGAKQSTLAAGAGVQLRYGKGGATDAGELGIFSKPPQRN